MGGKNRGKKWNRKRKAAEANAKAGKQRDNKNWGGYATIQNSNAKFEAYYSMVGLHDTKYDASSGTFVECKTDDEKHAERDLFMSSCSSILPASFRVDRSLDEVTQKKILEEIDHYVGEEMELEIELPRRSAAFGGMKNILDKGTNAGADGKDDEKDDKADDDKKEDEGAAKDSEANKQNAPVIVKRTIAAAKPIPFISNSNGTTLGYQLAIDRRTIRRNKSLEPLHNWLKIQSDCGHITRQETVSMIPPVVLDAKEGMSVLDMCAAPGSKTCQLLEVVGGLSGKEGETEPPGYVVANDADAKRAYMLVNQLRRMNSPSVFVTSCDGQFFPICDAKEDKGTDKEGMFDRVLCDVPCSGDGTVRKNPGVWKHWNQLGSLSLHPLQLSIALRGARLTHVGGYMVYSTCSMNPMENESVVAELLRVTDGALVLEDPRDRMEGLLARPGWSKWRVLRESKNRTRKAMKDWKKKNNPRMQQKRKEWEEKEANGECPPAKMAKAEESKEDGGKEEDEKYVPSPYEKLPYVPPATWDEAALRERTESLGFVEYASFDDVEDEWKRRVRRSCFPPTDEEAKTFELHKTLRSLPQDMDTGGFFVALFKKVKPLPSNATDRMHALAKESRGGFQGEDTVKTGEESKKETASGKESEDVTMTESSAAEDKTDTEPESANKDNNADDAGEEVRKAPQGKVGMHHKHDKNKDLGAEDFIPADPQIWDAVVDEYGLGTDFPKEQFMVRASGEAKVLYFISRSIKKELIDHGLQDRVTVINSGLKAFERCSLQDKNSTYRLAQEGIHFVVPYVTKRILTANMDDFYQCVKEGFITFDKFSEPFQKQLEEMGTGSFLVQLEGYEKDIVKKMYLSMWRRQNSVNCFVTKIEMEGILSKLRALGHVAKEEEATEKAEDKAAEESAEKPATEDKMDTST